MRGRGMHAAVRRRRQSAAGVACWSPASSRRPGPSRPAAASPAGSSLALPGFSPRGEPGVAGGVVAGVVGVEVDEAALDLPVADLEDVAPATRSPFGGAGAPGAVGVLAVAGALAGEGVAAGEDPVEVRVVVGDRLDGAADLGEQPADLVLAGRQAPFREVDLG